MADLVGTVAAKDTISGSLNVVYGKDGASAYEVALANGFKGTEAEWLLSLKGEQGVSGVYVGSGEMPEDCNVQIDPDGEVLLPKISNFENDSGFITEDEADLEYAKLSVVGDGYELIYNESPSWGKDTDYMYYLYPDKFSFNLGRRYKVVIKGEPTRGTLYVSFCDAVGNDIDSTLEYKDGYYIGILEADKDLTDATLDLSLDTLNGVTGITDTMATVNPSDVALYIVDMTPLTERVRKVEMMINELCKPSAKIGYVDLPATGWVGENNLYSQVVAIEGVTERSQVDLTPDATQLAIFYEKDLTFVTENEGGIVTVYAIGQKPQNDYTIQVTITETERVSTDV